MSLHPHSCRSIWFRCDDAIVTCASLAYVLSGHNASQNEAAYIMFYTSDGTAGHTAAGMTGVGMSNAAAGEAGAGTEGGAATSTHKRPRGPGMPLFPEAPCPVEGCSTKKVCASRSCWEVHVEKVVKATEKYKEALKRGGKKPRAYAFSLYTDDQVRQHIRLLETGVLSPHDQAGPSGVAAGDLQPPPGGGTDDVADEAAEGAKGTVGDESDSNSDANS